MQLDLLHLRLWGPDPSITSPKSVEDNIRSGSGFALTGLTGGMDIKAAKLPCMKQKWRRFPVMIQMPDMAQEKNMIACFDLLHDIGHDKAGRAAQDRQIMAFKEYVGQCCFRAPGEMQGMGAHVLGQDIHRITA